MNTSQYVQLTEDSTDLIIPNGKYNANDVTSFNISNNTYLKSIGIGNNCYGKVRVFELDGLSELESMVIGQKSFSLNTQDPWNSQRSDGSYRIVNCPKLKTIVIGDTSFGDYHFFELRNLPSLKSFTLGTAVFNPVHSAVFESD